MKFMPVSGKLRTRELKLVFIAVVRHQFVMGIYCLIFLYQNSLGANQGLALTRNSFRIAHVQFSGFSSQRFCCSDGFHTMHVVCIDLLCVVCIGLLSAEFSTVNTVLSKAMF